MIAGKFFRALLFALLSAGIVTALYFARLLDAALVCRTDKRSAKAAELLGAAGFGRVVVLRGGMTLWNTRPRSNE